jgi:hypothetical protein
VLVIQRYMRLSGVVRLIAEKQGNKPSGASMTEWVGTIVYTTTRTAKVPRASSCLHECWVLALTDLETYFSTCQENMAYKPDDTQRYHTAGAPLHAPGQRAKHSKSTSSDFHSFLYRGWSRTQSV